MEDRLNAVSLFLLFFYANKTLYIIEKNIQKEDIIMNKVFISVGMRGREEQDVVSDILRANTKILEMLGEDVEIIDNWDCRGPVDAGRLYYLGEAIKKLGDCDICYFVKGWRNHKGCIVEYEICNLYDIKIIEEI